MLDTMLRWVARNAYKEEIEHSKKLHDLAEVLVKRISKLPVAVHEACAQNHANGRHGWDIMHRFMPFAAIHLAYETHIKLKDAEINALRNELAKLNAQQSGETYTNDMTMENFISCDGINKVARDLVDGNGFITRPRL